MEHFEQQLETFQQKFNVSEECLHEIKKLCMAHAINCSMDVLLLEQSSAWLVEQIMVSLEKEAEKLSQLENLL